MRLEGTLNGHGDADSGYVVEIAIPWAQLGVTPAAGMYLGLNLAVNDGDPTSATTFGSFDWARIAPASYAQPRRWKWVQLVDTVPPPDTMPPAVAITSPASGATVSGTMTIAGTMGAPATNLLPAATHSRWGFEKELRSRPTGWLTMAAPGWLTMGDPAWLSMGAPGWLSLPDPGGSLCGNR